MEGRSRRRDSLDWSFVGVVLEEEESSEERDSRSDLRISSSFLSRAASSAATREAMCSSRALAREVLVCVNGP